MVYTNVSSMVVVRKARLLLRSERKRYLALPTIFRFSVLSLRPGHYRTPLVFSGIDYWRLCIDKCRPFKGRSFNSWGYD